MNRRKNRSQRIGAGKVLSVVLMFLCLTFMTSLNYFLYPSQKQAAAKVADNIGSNTNMPPSGPTEEKSSSSGLSIIEEFLHDPHPVINFGVEHQAQLHGVADAQKILVYHGELLSPPPEV